MRTLYKMFIAAALLLCFTGTATAQDDPVHRQVIVMFEPTTVALPGEAIQTDVEQALMPATVRALLQEASAREIEKGFPDFRSADTLRVLSDGREYRVPDWTNLFVITLPEATHRDSLVARLERLPEVVYAEKNQRAETRGSVAGHPVAYSFVNASVPSFLFNEVIPPNQQYFDDQWGLKNQQYPGVDIRATYAWSITTGSTSEILGVIDSGVQSSHIDLSDKVIGPAAFSGSQWEDHGTLVAGVAAAHGDNSGGGIAGVDWRAQIYAGQAGTQTQTAQAIDGAVNANARVINNSWGYENPSTTLTLALRSAYEAGVLLVHANPYEEGTPNQMSDYPNNLGPWIVNVGAMAENGSAWFNTGAKSFTDVGAPGVNIISTSSRSGNPYRTVSGTSYAAPHVAGTATLMRAVDPNLRNYDIGHILKRTAQEYPVHDPEIGYGMIDAYKALQRVASPYTLTHGTANFNQIASNQLRQFTNSPGLGLAAGHYYADVWELTASAGYEYQETPWAWLAVTEKGYSYADPNNAQRWMLENITTTAMELKTVFYYLRTTIGGQPINTWVPFDPTAFYNVNAGRYEYTVNGIPGPPPPPPLSVALTGSTFLSANQTGNWTATTSGGQGSTWNFKWYTCDHGGSCVLRRNVNTSVNSDAFSYAWSVTGDHWVQVEATRGAETAWDSHVVHVSSGSCEPWEPCRIAHPGVDGIADAVPDDYILQGNYPNPFNPSTEIRFGLPETADVTLTVYDMTGKEVARLVNGSLPAGYHRVTWDASGLPSGIYLYRLTANDFAETGRMALVK